MRISDWSSDVCSSDLFAVADVARHRAARADDRVAADPHRRDERAVRSDEGIFADLGAIFEIAVIVASDDAGDDIGVRTDAEIAEIAQVIGFGALTDTVLFGFDEITNFFLFVPYFS